VVALVKRGPPRRPLLPAQRLCLPPILTRPVQPATAMSPRLRQNPHQYPAAASASIVSASPSASRAWPWA